uniref:Squamosa promoter binding protein n=1 Tax=Tetraselmis sp. GSL018 TaxID=582737 RepID=A0A061SGI3_9CHLO
MTICQVPGCSQSLSGQKPYYVRNKICAYHYSANLTVVNGTMCRFCQQCSKFHPVQYFDDNRKSCKAELLAHNRRRKQRRDRLKKLRSSRPQLEEDDSKRVPGSWATILSKLDVSENEDFSSRNKIELSGCDGHTVSSYKGGVTCWYGVSGHLRDSQFDVTWTLHAKELTDWHLIPMKETGVLDTECSEGSLELNVEKARNSTKGQDAASNVSTLQLYVTAPIWQSPTTTFLPHEFQTYHCSQ